jgi:energy-coupling factor transport system permease protein
MNSTAVTTKGQRTRASDEFDFLSNITVGQYIPTNSFVHRLDPRAKILMVFFLLVAIIFSRSAIALTIATLALALLVKASKLSLRYVFRGMLLALPILGFFFVMNLFLQGAGWNAIAPDDKVFLDLGWLHITRNVLHQILLGPAKIVSFLFILSVLTLTSKTTELTHGIELLFKPLQRFKFPAHELALTNMIALRFVPTLAGELERIVKAQASRCGNVRTKRTINPIGAAQQMMPMIVPLFINALRSAEDLILAMEARSYMGGEGRTKFVQFIAKPIDYIVVIAALAFAILLLVIPWPPISQWLNF